MYPSADQCIAACVKPSRLNHGGRRAVVSPVLSDDVGPVPSEGGAVDPSKKERSGVVTIVEKNKASMPLLICGIVLTVLIFIGMIIWITSKD